MLPLKEKLCSGHDLLIFFGVSCRISRFTFRKDVLVVNTWFAQYWSKFGLVSGQMQNCPDFTVVRSAGRCEFCGPCRLPVRTSCSY